MMSVEYMKKIMNIAVLMVFLMGCSLSYADSIRYYSKHHDNLCGTSRIMSIDPKKTLTLNSAYLPRIMQKQYGVGTCYFFSASFLLQYLFNQERKSNSRDLSIIELISKGSNGKIAEGGLPELVLLNIKKSTDQTIAVGADSIGYAELARQFLQLPKDAAGRSREFDITSQLRFVSDERDTLPQYNIYLGKGYFYDKQLNKIARNQSEIIREIRRLFESGDPVPISFSFCVQSENGKCIAYHAANITGVRTVECKDRDPWYYSYMPWQKNKYLNRH